MKSSLKHMLLSQAILLTAFGVFANGTGKHSSRHSDTGFFLNSLEEGPASKIILRGSLVSFNAASGRNFFTLRWNSVAANTCDHFDVEKSLDGQKFEKMGEVKGFDNASSEELYSFQDNFRPVTARKNDFYYRLKQVDVNGQVSYSKVLIARVYNTKILASLSVTPDPSINDILVNVQLKENAYVVMKITDKDGNQIVKKTARAENGLNTYKLDGTNQLLAGRYMLEIIVNSNERLTMQLEKS
ncbi:MAG TPA: hypothetical protein VK543_01975 [Puia sp.]|nr:hypothetical protein [Puia sp.]